MTRTALLLALMVLAVSCTSTPATLPCQVYLVGSFTPENNYALSVEADWPPIDQPQTWIEIGFLAPRPFAAPIDLVHVSGTQEVERWRLQVPVLQGVTPICRISPAVGGSNCGASIRVRPQNVRGYYYMLINGNSVPEAGMSVKLCAPKG